MSKPTVKLELISFKLCPFVERAVITLLHKEVDFKITYIDLNNPPEWFAEISPLGKVPVLKVGETEVLFESSVIQEYVDEITPPSLHPTDPLMKAKNRAWMSFGGELMGMDGLHGAVLEQDEAKCDSIIAGLKELLTRLEAVHSGKDYFNGQEFNLIDATYAPLLMRFDLLKQHCGLDVLADSPKLKHWQQTLVTRPCVKDSVVAEFSDMYRGMIKNFDGHLAKQLK